MTDSLAPLAKPPFSSAVEALEELVQPFGVKATLYTLWNILGMNRSIFSISRMCMIQISQAKPPGS